MNVEKIARKTLFTKFHRAIFPGCLQIQIEIVVGSKVCKNCSCNFLHAHVYCLNYFNTTNTTNLLRYICGKVKVGPVMML